MELNTLNLFNNPDVLKQNKYVSVIHMWLPLCVLGNHSMYPSSCQRPGKSLWCACICCQKHSVHRMTWTLVGANFFSLQLCYDRSSWWQMNKGQASTVLYYQGGQGGDTYDTMGRDWSKHSRIPTALVQPEYILGMNEPKWMMAKFPNTRMDSRHKWTGQMTVMARN